MFSSLWPIMMNIQSFGSLYINYTKSYFKLKQKFTFLTGRDQKGFKIEDSLRKVISQLLHLFTRKLVFIMLWNRGNNYLVLLILNARKQLTTFTRTKEEFKLFVLLQLKGDFHFGMEIKKITLS